jgi:hypothetical protein
MWVAADGRDEQWELRDSAASFGGLRLRRTAVGAGVSAFRSAGWRWSSAGELSHRAYRDMSGVAGTDSSLRMAGYQVKHTMTVARDMWRSPEDRIESRMDASAETARIWSQSSHLFERVQSSVTGRWLPEQTGDDYAVLGRVGGGWIFGQAPFDELFLLGLERDNDLRMRGHAGTLHGRKGSAPMGRSYVLANWEIDKNVYGNGLVRVKLSPFVDAGHIGRQGGLPDFGKWLWDTGVQVKAVVLGVEFTLTCGKDLRSGRNVFYVAAAR